MVGLPGLSVFSWQVQMAVYVFGTRTQQYVGVRGLLVHRPALAPNRNQLKKNPASRLLESIFTFLFLERPICIQAF